MFPKHYSVALPVFSGPMDLLLHLIEREELDITRVALAQVTDQYLAYVRQLEKHEIADLAEFLLIAARLLLAVGVLRVRALHLPRCSGEQRASNFSNVVREPS